MKADELREMFLGFFESKGHTRISGASLIPENDPTVLFTTAGMHPLVPYLLGEPHPSGTRLCDVQKCIRTGDIEEVGDASHLTFFEMLGNWSLGDYFKEEAIAWSYEFLTSKSYLGFDPDRLSVTVFEGEEGIPLDQQSIDIWKKIGVPDSRIHPCPRSDNWWGPAGQTGPCGPDTEMFIDTDPGGPAASGAPGDSPARFFEIWNDVFMQYNKTAQGDHEPLEKSNVDTGMGVERTIAMLQGKRSVFDTELFTPVVETIADSCGKSMDESDEIARAFRVVADHVRSAVFILGDDKSVTPSNLGQGYVLRRLIRRSVRFAKNLGLPVGFSKAIARTVIENYRHVYPELERNSARIVSELAGEEEKFEATLSRGMGELEKVIARMKEHNQTVVPGRLVFRLYDTCGFPLEFTEEICREQDLEIDREGYDKAFDKHREVSKKGAEKSFKGGLADHSEATTRLHTATHLLHKGLQMVLGDHAQQRGSNITPDRLRFDFSHPQKMTDDEKRQVEEIVNRAIQDSLAVSMEVMTLEDARKLGAMALFDAKYDEQIKVYRMGDFSTEVCGGPHVENTKELGAFRIVKEEASSAGVRRIRAVLE
ncbi:MAG: alanine--tRNA ligase [Verrucomicrobia bacterium]|nr:alanine--tRNA ligase [Verrucomicrobiota bacterium]MDA1087962.1 alanine--tRNA ligase [Verrucomicrobiota bacterium]